MMLLLISFCFFTIVLGAQLPAGVKLCHRSEPNFPQCVARNIGDGIKLFKNGNKELGLPKLEPFFVEQIEIKEEASRSNSIQQKYRNVYIHGLTEADVTKNFKMALDNQCSWQFDAVSPYVRMEADYEIKGQILVFPISSNGKCNITLHNILNKNRMACEKYTKKNQIHMKVTNYTMDMAAEKIEYNFDNIFPANEQISAEILKTINENAHAIFNDVKSGFEKAFSLIYISNANSVFSKIPIKDIFLD